MISDIHVGRTYPPTAPYLVSAAKVAEFAAALGDADNPACAGPDAVAPPTFAAVLSSAAWGAMFDDPELELSLSSTVHTDQRFSWSRPLRVGDAVTATLTIDRVRARGTSAFISITVTLDADGERVCDAASTLLHSWPEEKVA
ncbi:MAG: MaoC family dehydratase N-terminal domain-containing protein [Micropruina sp.]|uniref:FAS1-like dehydratase domain-containing protein n=1 Tax=Micropruina sp. TaxID=2737536 RepID=UPI0039E674EF